MSQPNFSQEPDNLYLAILLMAGAVCWADEQHSKGLISDEEYNKYKEPFVEFVKSFSELNEFNIQNLFAGKPMINPDCCCGG